MMSYDEISDRIEELADELKAGCTYVHAATVGLDVRCGPLHVCETYVMSDAPGQLEYYGGFEYCTHTLVVGGCRLYFAEDEYGDKDERVQSVIDRAMGGDDEESDD